MNHFGLIGKDLSYSFSKEYFTKKFKSESLIDHSYNNFELKSETELSEFLKNTNCKGFNVTIPYKEAIIPLLDELEDAAKVIKAVNTVYINQAGKRIGCNTDWIGFKKSVEQWYLGKVDKALVLGAGGASKAVVYALKMLNIPFTQVNRSKKKDCITFEMIDNELISEHQLVINCTPLGTWPNTKEFPQIPFSAVSKDHFFFDLIYNPRVSTFLKMAQNQSAKIKNGLEMLEIQAEEAWKIWMQHTI